MDSQVDTDLQSLVMPTNVIPFAVWAERRRAKQVIADVLSTTEAKLRLTTFAWALTLLRDAEKTLSEGFLSQEIETRLRGVVSLRHTVELLRKTRLAMPKGRERQNIEHFFSVTRMSRTPGAEVKVRLG